MSFPQDVGRSSSSKPTSKLDAMDDIEKSNIILTERELNHRSISKRSVWRRIMDFSSRQLSSAEVGRTRAWYARGIVVLTIMTIIGALGFLIWISLVLALIRRLTPIMQHNGVNDIVSKWTEPASASALQTSWLPNFSTGVIPKPIHSHNDYDRDIPLFRALSVGCTGVEADIWLENNDLQVGHTHRALRPARTLQSLYLNPIMNILNMQNKQNPNINSSDPLIGVFNNSPNETLVILLDFKTDPTLSFPLVLSQFGPLRDAGYLTHWDGSKLVHRPLTVVASGFASKRLDLIALSNGTVFADAPLTDLVQSNSPYNSSNSLYASAPLAPAIHGKVSFSGMNHRQMSSIDTMVKAAEAKGLRARFWATPSWPVGLRDKVWRQLESAQVGMLNVDDVRTAAMWNWRLCVVAGLRLC